MLERQHTKRQKRKTATLSRGLQGRSTLHASRVTNNIGLTCTPNSREEDRMKYSRRNFLKAAGSGAVVLTTVGAGARTAAAAAPPLAIPVPMTKETGSFMINGKPYSAEYEART